jgi:hypothetical protein
MNKDISGLKKSPIKTGDFNFIIFDLTVELPSSEQLVQLWPFFLSH